MMMLGALLVLAGSVWKWHELALMVAGAILIVIVLVGTIVEIVSSKGDAGERR